MCHAEEIRFESVNIPKRMTGDQFQMRFFRDQQFQSINTFGCMQHYNICFTLFFSNASKLRYIFEKALNIVLAKTVKQNISQKFVCFSLQHSFMSTHIARKCERVLTLLGCARSFSYALLRVHSYPRYARVHTPFLDLYCLKQISDATYLEHV